MSDEPRFDLAGNPLPPPPPAAPANPSYAPPLRPVGGPSRPPVGGPPPAYRGAPVGGPAGAPSYGGSPGYGGGSMAGTPGFEPVEPNNNARNIGLGIGGVVLVLLIIAAVMLIPRHTPAPTAFSTYSAADHSFSLLAPSGWTVDAPAADAKMSDGSASTVGGVLIHQNSASIDVTTDTYTTLVAYDVMNNNADPQSLTGSKAGVLHKQWHKRVAAEHKGYHETQIAEFDGQMEDARLAEWTATGNALGFGGAQHGYRASLTGGGKTAVVVCSCLESDWPALKPAFLKVLGSFAAGEAAAPEPSNGPAPDSATSPPETAPAPGSP